jgi:hypothetical protein
MESASHQAGHESGKCEQLRPVATFKPNQEGQDGQDGQRFVPYPRRRFAGETRGCYSNRIKTAKIANVCLIPPDFLPFLAKSGRIYGAFGTRSRWDRPTVIYL